jgi:hypothetical protein
VRRNRIATTKHALADPNFVGLETYFARSLGFALLALGLTTVVLSGALPLTSADAPANGVSPYASAAVLVSFLHHAAGAYYCWARYSWTGETGYALGCAGSTALAAFGLYCVMFAGDAAMVSKHHKFDQSTSGFPFKNAGSYRAKKKAL